MKNIPNLYIVGAAKAGTTYFTNILDTHKDIYVPFFQEPQYLASEFRNDINIKSMDEYLSLYDNRKESILVDGSTTYLYSREAAKNIYDLDKDAKIIIILREPIARTQSQYKFQVRNGKETKDINDILENYKYDLDRKDVWSFHYVETSDYYEQVKRYYQIFPKNNIKIVIFEELISNEQIVMEDVSKFLNIDIKDLSLNINHKNASNEPLIPSLNKYMSKDTFMKKIFKAIVPWKLRRAIIWNIHKYNQSDRKIKAKISNKNIEKLKEILYKNLEDLQELTTLDLKNIWKI
jgi:hypothetical protein